MDKQKIGLLFSRAAQEYDTFAWFPREVGRCLFRLFNGKCEAKNILDIGCGTGKLTIALSQRFPKARVVGFDLAEGMVGRAKNRIERNGEIFLCADLEKIPFKDRTFEVVFSNLVYQRIPDLVNAFKKVNRVLVPGGRFYLSLATEGTLKELQASLSLAYKKFSRVKLKEAYRHPSAGKITEALKKSGFRIIRIEKFKKQKDYSNVTEIIKWLKKIGANYYYEKWAKGLNSRPVIKEMDMVYRSRYGNNGKIGATFEAMIIETQKR